MIEWGVRHDMHGIAAAELPRRVGRLAQLARIDRFIEDDGPERGARRIRLVTGGGLEIDLHPDRALDLGHVTFGGVPVAWSSPTGVIAPGLAESRGTQWLRSFGGGLLSTCGLDTFGPPSMPDGKELPMHGRIGVTPARLTETSVVGGVLTVAGTIRQASVFGENLVLNRRITADVGGASVTIQDEVVNEGLDQVGHMVLYHANIGWPLLSEGASLVIPGREVAPRDATASEGVARWHQIEPPQAGYAEQVFRHEFKDMGVATVAVDNPELDLRLEMSFDTSILPALYQWKMSGEGHYVMGLEPANTGFIGGHESARAAGELPVLRVGESASYSIKFVFGPSRTLQEGGSK